MQPVTLGWLLYLTLSSSSNILLVSDALPQVHHSFAFSDSHLRWKLRLVEKWETNLYFMTDLAGEQSVCMVRAETKDDLKHTLHQLLSCVTC